MIFDIEARHLAIVTDILKKYDYSFFVFGSRIKGTSRRLSDLDLLYFEQIPNREILQLEEDFEESDLPYKVDLVNHTKCDESFKKSINGDYVSLQKSSSLELIESNHLEHFTFLPKIAKFNVSEVDGATVINCGLKTSMFNIVYGAPKGSNFYDFVQKIKKTFNDQPLAWWVPPSQHNQELTKALLDNGFIIEAQEQAMICDLAKITSLNKKTGLVIKPIISNSLLQDFIDVIETYDSYARNFYEALTNEHLQLQEKFFVGYEQKKPVTIGILFVSGISVGIFSLITSSEAQQKGYGADMMRFLIKTAKEFGCKFATLSASSDSGHRIYERFNFNTIGNFECFEFNNHFLTK